MTSQHAPTTQEDSGLNFAELLTLGLFLLLLTDRWFRANDVLTWSLAFGSVLAAFYVRERNRRLRRQFRQQIQSCRKELRTGSSILVDHLVLRKDSRVTTYRALVGVLIFAIEVRSPYRPAQGQHSGEGLLYSAISMVTGWWVIPSGPLRTLLVLRSNLAGGEMSKVLDLAGLSATKQQASTDRVALTPSPSKRRLLEIAQRIARRPKRKDAQRSALEIFTDSKKAPKIRKIDHKTPTLRK